VYITCMGERNPVSRLSTNGEEIYQGDKRGIHSILGMRDITLKGLVRLEGIGGQVFHSGNKWGFGETS